MFEKRNRIVLLGAALIAFALFILWGERGTDGEGTAREGQPKGQVVAEQSPAGAPEASADDAALQGGSQELAERLKAQGRKRPPGAKPDPELVKKLPVADATFIAEGPPTSPREGIVEQRFSAARGTAARTASISATQVSPAERLPRGRDEPADAGSGPPAGDPGASDTGSTCPDCGAPSVKTTVIDLEANPWMRSGYDPPCKSAFYGLPYAERFDINGAPACVIRRPESCRGSGVALFEGRYAVTIQGECFPSLEYMKKFLKR
jgi:hypothetical protein